MLKSSPEPGDKDMVDLNVLADSTCRYDLDEMDVFWLNEINEEKQLCGKDWISTRCLIWSC